MVLELEKYSVWKNYTDLVSEKNHILGVKSGVRKHYTMSCGESLRTLQVALLGDCSQLTTAPSLGSQVGRHLWEEQGPQRPLRRNTKEKEERLRLWCHQRQEERVGQEGLS